MALGFMTSLILVGVLTACLASASSIHYGTEPEYYDIIDNCNQIITSKARLAFMVGLKTKHHLQTNWTSCDVTFMLILYQLDHFSVSFDDVHLQPADQDGVCRDTRLDIYSGYNVQSRALTDPRGICGDSLPGKDYTTGDNNVTLRLRTRDHLTSQNQSFQALVTPYHLGSCFIDEFQCANLRCIVKQLRCDGYNNCRDNSDEMNCIPTMSVGVIAAIVAGCVIFVGLLFTILACRCCCGVCDDDYEEF